MLLLRVRSAAGTAKVTVDEESSFSELRQAIAGVTGVEPAAQKLSYGFPPRTLRVEDNERVATTLSHGELVGVERDASVTAPAPALATTATTASASNAESAHEELPPTPRPSAAAQDETTTPAPLFVRRTVPDDNSCLFRALAYVLRPLLGSQVDVAAMRDVIATAVSQDPEHYSEAFLGKSNGEYQRWIRQPNTWGGAVELAVLSKHFAVQIASFDVRSQRMDCYGGGAQPAYSTRVYLLYDGIHYDPLALSPMPGADEGFDETVFSADDGQSEQMARALAAEAHEKRQYTDTANFTLQCGQCSAKLRGEQEALEHAKSTGHSQFSEARSSSSSSS